MYNAKILCDSISPDDVRITTLEVTFPRIVLAEFNTHRVFSRNSASSRAIPIEKQIKRVLEDPFVPEYWGKNQKGMQAYEELSNERPHSMIMSPKEEAIETWKLARDEAIYCVRKLQKLDVHKQLANRLLEPFMWQTVLVTSTEWSNWDGLRRHKDAQPEIKRIADLIFEARENSAPMELGYGQWHMPLVQDYEELKKEFSEELIHEISVGRCCRVSYLTHDGKRNPQADIDLCRQLRMDGHMSPFEHLARPMTKKDAEKILKNMAPVSIDTLDIEVKNFFSGNFRGWVPYRKEIPFEDDYSKIMGIQ